jgi:hypothetical protein
MHDPNNWLAWYDANNPYNPPPWYPGWPGPDGWYTVPSYESNLQHYQAYVIDPLYISRFLNENPTAPPAQIALNTARFPYGTTAPLYMARCSWVTDAVTRQWLQNDPNPPIRMNQYVRWLPSFDRIFAWPDDQLFDLPADLDQRPTGVFDTAGIGQFEGNYSWLATVCPVPIEAGQTVADKTHYEVSVVVFYQRDFTPPSTPADPDKPGERWLTVLFTGAGLGGGDVTLQKRPGDPQAWLEVREGDWIMLGGQQSVPGYPPSLRNIFKWYRVIAAEPQDPNNQYSNDRRATLTGLDWSPNWTSGDNDGNGVRNALDGSLGVVCSGVAGVYTQVMELDQ